MFLLDFVEIYGLRENSWAKSILASPRLVFRVFLVRMAEASSYPLLSDRA